MSTLLGKMFDESPDNQSCWQDNGHRYEQVLSSRVALAVVSVFYVYRLTFPADANLKKSRLHHFPFVISILSALFMLMEIILRHLLDTRGLVPVDYSVDAVALIAWLFLSSCLWKLHTCVLFKQIHVAVVRSAWFLTILATGIRLASISQQLVYRDGPITTIKEGVIFAWTGLQIIFLFTLSLSSPHVRSTSELNDSRSNGNIKRNVREGDPSSLSCEIKHVNEAEPIEVGVAEDSAGLLSRLSFRWVEPLMQKGVLGQLLKPTDVFLLPEKLTPKYVESYFSGIYPQGTASFAENLLNPTKQKAHVPQNHEDSSENQDIMFNSNKQHSSDQVSTGNAHDGKPESITLRRALLRAFGFRYFLIGIIRLAVLIFAYLGPLLLNALVTFMENGGGQIRYGFCLTAGLFLATFVHAIIDEHRHCQKNKLVLRVRIALITTIYRKALAVSATTLSAFTTGEIVNFMSVDTGRVIGFIHCFHELWGLPVEVAVCFYLLYLQVGISGLGGVAFAILLIPFNKWITATAIRINEQLMKRKDERVKVMDEILKGIRVIKFYAWERHFTEQVNKLRSKELSSLRGIKYIHALCVYIWSTTPVFISIITFTSYTLLGNQLTAAKVFTCISLFRMLICPLNAFTWIVNGIIESSVSIKRLQSFMDLEETNFNTFYQPEETLSCGAYLEIKEGNFHWEHPKKEDDSTSDKDAEEEIDKTEKKGGEEEIAEGRKDREIKESLKLKNLQLKIKKGQLIGVIGRVGAGKSSLLSAITADMAKESGEITVAKLGQGFGLATQEPWLQHATLKENILFGKQFDAGWYTRVVEACALVDDIKMLPSGDETEIGENGVTLSGGQKARVALARAVYQDNDIYLLDDPLAAVDAHVGSHIFSRCIMGVLRHKTRVLCTHHTKYLMEADTVLVMDDCEIKEIGPPKLVLSHCDISTKQQNSESQGETKSDSAPSKEEVKSRPGEDQELVKEEEKAVGSVKFGVVTAYLSAIGSVLMPCILLFVILHKVTRNMSDWWMSYWVSHFKDFPVINATGMSSTKVTDLRMTSPLEEVPPVEVDGDAGSSLLFYLGVFGGLVAANSLFTLLRAFLFVYGGLCAATLIHSRLLNSIFKAPISFFDGTPLGRIINRFSNDVNTIDVGLPMVLDFLINDVFSLAAILVMTCYSLPWFSLFLLPIGLAYYVIQNDYRKASRELRRLHSVSNSAIFSHFSETLAGLPVIKALRATERLRAENRTKLELNQRVWFSSASISFWLGLRMRLLAVAIVTAVAVLALLQHHYHSVDPALAGMAISYALSITHFLISTIHCFSETEKNLISAERAEHYTVGIPAEQEGGVMQAPQSWPSRGVVKFDDVHFAYRVNHPKALDGVTFETRPGEKIGVVGRTGSGKSTLFLVLFRMVQIQEGKVSIDGVNLADLSLQEMRSKLAIIPQDPFLFSGTIRENLDPVGQFTDSELWNVLTRCHVKEVVERLGGLEGLAGERGKRFSAGQKQLLCLARAMLTRAKVLCIDEATASVDMETDSHLQQAIREEFADNTVLTIAHRINTVTDSDRILVMDKGKVAEFGPPGELLADSSSVFHGLVHKSLKNQK